MKAITGGIYLMSLLKTFPETRLTGKSHSITRTQNGQMALSPQATPRKKLTVKLSIQKQTLTWIHKEDHLEFQDLSL